ncbi:PTS phosphocarrier protein NPr [Morganella psychrotolerans]|uniref:Phosphocarrier protein NPr n=1 Tax=Morganella psychrotolerans TaxID=368603 RepID=A0A1B8H451_9GAMM|nr:PTS phosphocarrier protein NPr [Morganella psychrotolerans]KAA8715608.1 PTS phosphocarrier protein NPr [Morganella psychrotolerans]OBU03836.1 phosphohistidinoprotein-hexose phosphotransferase [Morganella psychrotolerans]OBU05643.1 phosphohistidinoprotein-hexose phosphotransferase [Morganella psychrotolerans]HCM61049.1 HPr family phosphocarrier protein [Morganella sp. (in: enterobacteria)]
MTIRCQVEIKNRLGLHARPAMKLVELIQTFRSTVIFRNKQNEEARADSVLAMLMLDSEQGSIIEVEATGPDENLAIEAIISLFDSGFDED